MLNILNVLWYYVILSNISVFDVLIKSWPAKYSEQYPVWYFCWEVISMDHESYHAAGGSSMIRKECWEK